KLVELAASNAGEATRVLVYGLMDERGKMMTRLPGKRWMAPVMIGLFLIGQVLAQLITADIMRTITDSSGQVVPNAKVTVVNTATGDTRAVLSTGTADFLVNLLPPGAYTVT